MKVRAADPTTAATLDRVAPGTYAIAVFHDENENDELDTPSGADLSLREAGERLGYSREAMKKLYARALRRFLSTYQSLRGGSHG